MACGTLFAQPIVENLSSSSAVVVRDPARQSSTEVDAAIYNPAGTAFVKEGLSFSVSGIANFGQTKANDGTKSYKINENYVMPSVQLAFKKGKWAFSGSFASEGGYKRNYKDGSPALDAGIGSLSEALTSTSNYLQLQGALLEIGEEYGVWPNLGINSDDEFCFSQYSTKCHLYNWAIRLGTAYQISQNLSAYVGVRLNRVSWKAKTNVGMAVYNPSSETTTPFAEYSKNVAEQFEKADDESLNDIKESTLNLLQVYDEIGAVSSSIIDSCLSHAESGWGIAPIIGLDYKGKTFNIGMKYEFGSHINIGDGEDFTLPAILSLGGNWQAMRWLNVAVGGDLYFKSAGNPFSAFDDNLYWDASVSATFTCNKSLKANIGWQIGKQTYLVEDFTLRDDCTNNAYAFPSKFSAGIRYAFTDKISMDLGVALMTQQTSNVGLNWGSMSHAVTYKKRTPVQVALGFNYGL